MRARQHRFGEHRHFPLLIPGVTRRAGLHGVPSPVSIISPMTLFLCNRRHCFQGGTSRPYVCRNEARLAQGVSGGARKSVGITSEPQFSEDHQRSHLEGHRAFAEALGKIAPQSRLLSLTF